MTRFLFAFLSFQQCIGQNKGNFRKKNLPIFFWQILPFPLYLLEIIWSHCVTIRSEIFSSTSCSFCQIDASFISQDGNLLATWQSVFIRSTYIDPSKDPVIWCVAKLVMSRMVYVINFFSKTYNFLKQNYYKNFPRFCTDQT